jgi:hypothetical protein
LSVPVLSRSLIGDRTATDGDAAKRPRPAAKQWPSTEAREQDRVRPERLAQACRWAQPLPAQSPTTPTLRANPYPEVTDPICRLPLPTLFYRPEAVHLGDLLRIWVRAGASPPSPPRDFQGPAVCSWMPRELRHSSPKTKTHSPCETIQGPRRLMQKRQLFPELRPASPGRVALPRRIRGSESVPRPGSGIWTGFPFGVTVAHSKKRVETPRV